MGYNYKIIPVSIFVFLLIAAYIQGCVSYEQTTTLNEDGSGSMSIHYWSTINNIVKGGGDSFFAYYFDENKAKEEFTSSNTQVNSVKIEEKLEDSTKHVRIELTFKDINKLFEARGFKSSQPTWKESSDGMELRYILKRDSVAHSRIVLNEVYYKDYYVTYTFNMPNDIVSTNASKKEGNTLTWEFKLTNFNKDIEMIANVKKTSKGKLCGIIPLIVLSGLLSFTYYKRKIS
ncbi:MAG: hypothetical protein EHM58_08935 [Ignavibacteriae bacterium]|nr:MAG: hypothetical protein EHM58_08935 [Ignavibacteriota bacterium]